MTVPTHRSRIDFEGLDSTQPRDSAIVLDLLEALRRRDAALYVDQTGALRYAGPPLPADSPIRAAIATLKPLLVELFTYSPGGRCADPRCYRLTEHTGEHLALYAPTESEAAA